jgi:hypothetical protein
LRGHSGEQHQVGEAKVGEQPPGRDESLEVIDLSDREGCTEPSELGETGQQAASLPRVGAASVPIQVGDASVPIQVGAASVLIQVGAASVLIQVGAASVLIQVGAASVLIQVGAASVLVRESRLPRADAVAWWPRSAPR